MKQQRLKELMNNDNGLKSIRGNLEIIAFDGHVTYPSEIADVNVEVKCY